MNFRQTADMSIRFPKLSERITFALFVLTFFVGAYVGTTASEKRIAERCLAGERMRIAAIEIKCPDVPGWRE